MIAARSRVESYAEKGTGVGENATEGATGVDNNKAAHADLEKNVLEQKPSELVGVNVGDGDADDELRQIAHGG